MFSSLTLESTSADMHRRTLITRRSSEAWQTITRPRHHVTTSIVCTQTAMLTSESIVTSRTLCQQPVTTATVTLTTRLTPASQLAIDELTRLLYVNRCEIVCNQSKRHHVIYFWVSEVGARAHTHTQTHRQTHRQTCTAGLAVGLLDQTYSAQRFFNFSYFFFFFYFGSCGRLSWLNCQLSSAR